MSETPTETATDTPATFEAALAALEERVRKLEGGDLPLDQSLSLYEEGVALARQCHGLLDRAEERVSAVVQGATGPETRPLDDPSA